MILCNDGLVAFHYKSYGIFFYPKIGSIISIGDLITTNIIEPIFLGDRGILEFFWRLHFCIKLTQSGQSDDFLECIPINNIHNLRLGFLIASSFG